MRLNLDRKNIKLIIDNDEIVIQKEGLLKRAKTLRLIRIAESIEESTISVHSLRNILANKKSETIKLKNLFAKELFNELGIDIGDWVESKDGRAYEIDKIIMRGSSGDLEYEWYHDDVRALTKSIDGKDKFAMTITLEDIEARVITKIDKPDIEIE